MLAIHQNGTSTISTKTTRPTTVTTRAVIGFAVGAPAQGSGARRSAREPACSLDLPSGRPRRGPAPPGRAEKPPAPFPALHRERPARAVARASAGAGESENLTPRPPRRRVE